MGPVACQTTSGSGRSPTRIPSPVVSPLCPVLLSTPMQFFECEWNFDCGVGSLSFFLPFESLSGREWRCMTGKSARFSIRCFNVMQVRRWRWRRTSLMSGTGAMGVFQMSLRIRTFCIVHTSLRVSHSPVLVVAKCGAASMLPARQPPTNPPCQPTTIPLIRLADILWLLKLRTPIRTGGRSKPQMTSARRSLSIY